MPEAVEAFPNPWATSSATPGNARARGRGKGEGKGKLARRGRADNDAPDFTAIDDARRAMIEDRIRNFHDALTQESDAADALETELTFESDLSSLERRLVYTLVEQLQDLHARSVGTGRDRRIVVSRKTQNGQRRHDVSDIEPRRYEELKLQLEALKSGTERGAVPRPGDHVEILRILGPDPLHLEGRVGEILGAAQLPILHGVGGAYTVHFAADGAAFGDNGLNLTVAAADLRVVDPIRPLVESSLAFPKSLTGLERKAVHEIAESLGLITQSFGEGRERYITVFRPGGDAKLVQTVSCTPVLEGELADELQAISFSGVHLDDESHASIMQAVDPLPVDWRVWASRMIVCKGPLRQPRIRDRRSVGDDLMTRIRELREGDKVQLRVVTVGRSERAVAFGVLGVPALGRNPHVLVAAATGSGPWEAENISQWVPWTGNPLTLSGHVEQWHATRSEPDASETIAASRDQEPPT